MFIQPLVQPGIEQKFRLQLLTATASVAGGARLLMGQTVCAIEPFGVIQFSEQSRHVSIDQYDGNFVPVTTSFVCRKFLYNCSALNFVFTSLAWTYKI
jgi:hypothetical protein